MCSFSFRQGYGLLTEEMIMYLTDEQLMLLEQLTYLTDDVADAAGVLLGPYDSVEDLLQQFDEEALQKLEDSGKTFNYTGAEKWAAIIRQIKNDADLYSLDIVDKDDSVPALCFNDPDDPEHAVVVFRGTSGKDEWIDNAIGLGVSDTERQKAALDYIENLPYDSITVAGHSKGGNKAQYVTILSDKIDRCVSMDGQGFSQEFLDKYYAEIQEKGHCIKNYYLDGDFVNILMFPVPGSDQICIAGDRSVVGPANHCPSSFYQFLRDEEGHWYIDSDENGDTILIPGTREEVMVYLHEFTTFIINVMPEDERERAGDYIGHILALAFVPDAHLDVDGKVYTPDDLVEYLLSDPDMLSKVLAYFVRYVETYNPSEDEIRSLAEVFGMTELLGEIEDVAEEHDSSLAQMISDAGGLLNLIIDQIRDGENDPIIGVLLWLANGLLSEKLETEVDLPALWKKLEAEYQSIPEFDAETARQDAACKEGKIRDFSERTYGILMSAIAAVEEDTYGSVSGWTQYAGEAWYDSLFIPNAIGGINAYFERVSEISRICRSSVDRIYGQADEADRRNAGRLRQSTEGLKALRQKIEQKTAELGG